MGIKEQLAAVQSSFIPLAEALSFVIDTENVDLQTAATWLLHHNVEGGLAAFFLTNTFNLVELNYYGGQYQEIYTELKAIIDDDFGFYGLKEIGNKSIGWLRDDFHAFIRKHLDSDNANSQRPPEEANQHLSYEAYLLRKQSLFTIIDAACLISDDSVTEIARCQNDTNFNRNYSSFKSASNFIESCIYANELDFDNRYIPRESLINLFNKKDIVIDGFNDGITNNKTPDNTEHNKLKAENAQLKQRIAELERQLKQSQQLQHKPDTPTDFNLLAYILDSTQNNYAPDLALSIKLYKYVYIDNPRQDSHSSKANTWIKNNTGYGESSQSGSRIREITAPLNGWNPQRDKNFLNK